MNCEPRVLEVVKIYGNILPCVVNSDTSSNTFIYHINRCCVLFNLLFDAQLWPVVLFDCGAEEKTRSVVYCNGKLVGGEDVKCR